MKPGNAVIAGLLCASAAMLPATAAAQTEEAWQFRGTIYGWFPSISGTTTFPPPIGGTPVAVDAGQIIDALKMVFMGTLEVQKGRWGAFTDVVYLDVGAGKSATRDFTLGGGQLPVGVTANADLDLKSTIWTIAGNYRIIADPASTFDGFAGVRLLNMKPRLNFTLTGNVGSIALPDRSGTREVSESNWDFIVGVKGRVSFGDNREWFVPYYLDIGTGDSQLTWQALAGIGYAFHWGEVTAAWRYLDYNMKSGSLVSDLTVNGPALAVSFRW